MSTMAPAAHFDRDAVMRLPPTLVADAMATAFRLVTEGRAVTPARGDIDLEEGAGSFLISGGFRELDVLTVKVIHVRPQNPLLGLARLQGGLLAFSYSTGELLATIDATAATEVRTAACSALSVRLLAALDATVMTVFGTAAQARGHVRAIRAERQIREVRVVGRSAEHARAFALEVGGAATDSVRAALAGAHIVVAATNSRTPIFPAEGIEPGSHFCAVGNGARDAQELDPMLFGRCEGIYVDHMASCLREAGELIAAIDSATIRLEQVHELGDVITGRSHGRLTAHGITGFKSVGHGTQDAALAALLLGRV